MAVRYDCAPPWAGMIRSKLPSLMTHTYTVPFRVSVTTRSALSHQSSRYTATTASSCPGRVNKSLPGGACVGRVV